MCATPTVSGSTGLIERDTAMWRTMTSEFTLPRGATVAQVHFAVCGPAGTLEMDDVVVEAVGQ